MDTSRPTTPRITVADQISVEEQIRLLELGIEVQILTADDLARLKTLGIDSTNSEKTDTDK